jgi:hypothetical protein
MVAVQDLVEPRGEELEERETAESSLINFIRPANLQDAQDHHRKNPRVGPTE